MTLGDDQLPDYIREALVSREEELPEYIRDILIARIKAQSEQRGSGGGGLNSFSWVFGMGGIK